MGVWWKISGRPFVSSTNPSLHEPCSAMGHGRPSQTTFTYLRRSESRFHSDVEAENFFLEWATTPNYAHVTRSGGAERPWRGCGSVSGDSCPVRQVQSAKVTVQGRHDPGAAASLSTGEAGGRWAGWSTPLQRLPCVSRRLSPCGRIGGTLRRCRLWGRGAGLQSPVDDTSAAGRVVSKLQGVHVVETEVAPRAGQTAAEDFDDTPVVEDRQWA